MTNILAGVTGRIGRFLRAELKTLREVFRYVQVFPATPDTALDEAANWMLIASDAALAIPDAIEVRTGRDDPVLTDRALPYSVLHAVAEGL